MPTPPGIINLTPASPPGAPGTIDLNIPVGYIISGVTSPLAMNGTVYEAGEVDGKMSYSTDGALSAPVSGDWVSITWTDAGSGFWGIALTEDGVAYLSGGFISTSDTATPDLATFTPQGTATGTLLLTSTGPGSPGVIPNSPAGAPGAPATISKTPATPPGAPSTITNNPAPSNPSPPGIVTPC